MPTEVPATDAPTDAPVATGAPATDAPVATDQGNSGDKDNTDNTPKKGLPTGAIIGIVIGAVAVAAVISGVIISRSKKK